MILLYASIAALDILKRASIPEHGYIWTGDQGCGPIALR